MYFLCHPSKKKKRQWSTQKTLSGGSGYKKLCKVPSLRGIYWSSFLESFSADKTTAHEYINTFKFQFFFFSSFFFQTQKFGSSAPLIYPQLHAYAYKKCKSSQWYPRRVENSDGRSGWLFGDSKRRIFFVKSKDHKEDVYYHQVVAWSFCLVFLSCLDIFEMTHALNKCRCMVAVRRVVRLSLFFCFNENLPPFSIKWLVW